MGISATNALSQYMRTIVKRDRRVHMQEYKRGVPQKELKAYGDVPVGVSGTTQYFRPDEEVFTSTKIDERIIKNRLKEQAYLTAGVLFVYRDIGKSEVLAFRYEDGIVAFVQEIATGRYVMFHPFYVKGKDGPIEVEVALLYTDSSDEKVRAFANNIYNREGGTHVTGFRSALTYAINSYALSRKLIKEKHKLTSEDIKEGLAAVISVRLPNPQYEGQTKLKLNNPEARSAVYNIVSRAFYEFLEKNPKIAKAIVNRVLLTRKAREAAKAAKKAVLRKSALSVGSLPGKLADCSIKDPSKAELFIVEGDSAGGSAKQARDRETQAVLPLRGKPVNPEKNRIDRVLANEKIADVIRALGIGVGDSLDLSKLRYHKIIIMTDADVDGMHIITLLLTLFYRYMRPLLEKGYIYVAQPPLFKVEIGNKKYWFLNEEEKDRFVEKALAEGKKIKNVQRFKGLGEMNPEQLWETTMDPSTRVLKQISIEDAHEADRLFRMFMGEEVQPRREFILKYARLAEVDI